MPKNSKDIKIDPSHKKIDLKGKVSGKKKPIEKTENNIYKEDTPIREVKDLYSSKKENYIYIRGKKFNPPKYLGNLIRVALAGFLIIFAINIVNVYVIGKTIEKDISDTAYQGYNYILDAGKSATQIQFDNALESFDKAITNFEEAEDELWFINTDYSFYNEDSSVGQAVNAMLEGGKYFSFAGKYFLEAVEEFNKIPLYFVTKNNPDQPSPPSITDSLRLGLEKTDLAIEQINLASEQILTIEESTLPPELRARVTLAKTKIEEISNTLAATSEYFPAILKLLGDRYPHRYLILFQNNNEIRPSGGFIGSYAIMDINEGYIEKLETYDVYDIDGSYGGIIEPPEEFKPWTKNWRLRDSNYSPDFPTSAKKARWFLEKEGGPTVDTVIAINQGLLMDMLEITGPIQVGNFGALDSENYNLLLSYVIEGKVWGEEDPKHLLKVFVPLFKEAILKEENISKVSSKMYKAIQQKHIMMYSSDEEIQALFESTGLDGSVHISEPEEDYLSVIHISTGGTKSEQFMEEVIQHHTDIDINGKITNEITVERSHLWTDEIYFMWKKILAGYGFDEMPDNIIDILGRGENKVSTRIYVPEGSVLIETDGADVQTMYDKDLKKTYFFLEMNTKAGETSEVWIKYSLPFTLDFEPVATYKLIIEKQPGSKGSIFTKTVSKADEIYSLSIHPEDATLTSEGDITYATTLVYDKYFSALWGK
ncbi:MAG: DUF4012 domain-containing protein [Nitrospirota bacterium]